MKINGVIAEYNPFHNGHKYHLEESKRLTGADYTIVVMSGNFVQRGAPALLDKRVRAEMALQNGADLVLELPAIYAVSSAEYFASGAVALLNSLNVVTHLCFGSECGDILPLQQIASILQSEPEQYRAALKDLLRQGYSYPTARSEALIKYDPSLAQYSKIFSAPNNILGIEYIRALLTQNSPMLPTTILRTGSGYHDRIPGTGYCSALAIRQSLSYGNAASSIQAYMPGDANELLASQLVKNPAVDLNALSGLLYYKLILERDLGFKRYLDVSADLSDRIRKKIPEYRNYKDFSNLLKTKELTYTRICRCLLHILLDITKDDMAFCRELGYAPYARVLGFRKDASGLLNLIKKNTSIPLITKPADAEQILAEKPYAMFRQDTQVSQLYYGVLAGLTKGVPANEYTIPLVIV